MPTKRTLKDRERSKLRSLKKRKDKRRLFVAFSHIKSGKKTLTKAAKDLHLSPKRVRIFLLERGDYVRQGPRYHFIPRRRNDLPLYSNQGSIRVLVDDANASSLGEFMAGVRKFLRTNKIQHLSPFVGGGITDVKGQFHRFETGPEELYRLDAKGRAVFHQIYHLSN